MLAAAHEEPGAYVQFHKGLHALLCAQVPPARQRPFVELHYGPTGCGKSFNSRRSEDGSGLQFRLDYARLVGGSAMWFDGYMQQPLFIFDDFVGAASHVSLSYLLELLDVYHLDVPVKGAFTPWIPTAIAITTNIHPRQWYDYDGRMGQYSALQRRIGIVYYYGFDGKRGATRQPGDGPVPSLDDYDEYDAWERFWAGPRTVEPLEEPRMGVRVQVLDEYEFMFN